ncbi:MAG: transporter substrate-binding domain-containing protein [Bacteroidota bacterium]
MRYFSIDYILQLSNDQKNTICYSAFSKLFERFFLSGQKYAYSQFIPKITYQNPLQGLHSLARQEADALVYDQTILRYLLSTYQLEDKVTLLPISFNKQYEGFLFSKKHPDFESVNSALIQQIQEGSWQQLLKKYGLQE